MDGLVEEGRVQRWRADLLQQRLEFLDLLPSIGEAGVLSGQLFEQDAVGKLAGFGGLGTEGLPLLGGLLEIGDPAA